jgi:hypothetical protein
MPDEREREQETERERERARERDRERARERDRANEILKMANGIFRKYGVYEPNVRKVLAMCDAFVSELKPDVKNIYTGILGWLGCLISGSAPPVHVDSLSGQQKSTTETGGANCELVLAEFLLEMASQVTQRFFNTLIIFVGMYKDAMNEYGWNVISRYKRVSEEDKKEPFAALNGPEHMPEICNDFIRTYIPRMNPNIEQPLAIDLTTLLCEWLTKKRYTHTKITRL